MSAYDNVIGGKLKLKGKALDVKAGGVKKKKKQRKHEEQALKVTEHEIAQGENAEALGKLIEGEGEEAGRSEKASKDAELQQYDDRNLKCKLSNLRNTSFIHRLKTITSREIFRRLSLLH